MKRVVIKKRSITVARHKTSISLEDEFWDSLQAIAAEREETIAELIAGIDTDRRSANLSCAIRLFILHYYQHRLDQQRTTIAPADPDPSNPIEHDAH